MDSINKLDEYLNDKVTDVHNRTIVAWGMGNTGLLYYEGLKRLEKEDFRIDYYTNSNIQVVSGDENSSYFNGKPVISPESIVELKNPLVLIITPNKVYVDEIMARCEEMQVEARLIDDVIFRLHSKEIMECMSLFSDDRSREIYAKVLVARINAQRPDPSLVVSRSLFNVSEFFAAERAGRYVDCGAFVGDSIESYIRDREDSYGAIGKITAFEPDENNYAALSTRVDRLKREWSLGEDCFTLYKAGVGEHTVIGTISEESNGMQSKLIEDGEGKKTQIYALDDVIKEQVSFIKADIESYEYQMLAGAKNTIRRYRPNLAICIYHNAVDFYQIPILVHEICPDYKLMIRQHSFESAETILYAWV